MTNLPRNLLILAVVVLLLVLAGGCGETTRTVEADGVRKAAVGLIAISSILALVVGIFVGSWLETTNAKAWKSIADSRRDEASQLTDRLAKLKKKLKRIAEDCDE